MSQSQAHSNTVIITLHFSIVHCLLCLVARRLFDLLYFNWQQYHSLSKYCHVVGKNSFHFPGNTSLYDDSYKIELLYLVGKSGMATTDNMVLRESTEHKDVLLADYKVRSRYSRISFFSTEL